MAIMACVEITNVCNCACAFCPYPSMKRQKQFMPLGLVRTVIAQMAEFNPNELCLHIMGEPTLHPSIAAILSYCAALDLRMMFTSNGTTDRFADVVCLVRRGTIVYSLQTPQHRYHLKGSPIPWQEQMKKLASALERFLTVGNAGVVRFEIHILDTRGRGGPKVADSDQDIRAAYSDMVRVMESVESRLGQKAYPRPGLNLASLAFSPLGHNVYFHLKPYTAFAGAVSGEVRRGEHIACSAPESQIIVLVNGDVIQCCLTSENPFLLGNVTQTPIRQLRQGHRFDELKSRCSGRLPALPSCRMCEQSTPL